MNQHCNFGHYRLSNRTVYLATAVLLILSSMLNFLPSSVFDSNHVYLIYFPAVVIAAVIGGFYAGIFATFTACIIISLLLRIPVSEPIIKNAPDGMDLLIFVWNGVLISASAQLIRYKSYYSRSINKQFERLINGMPDGLVICNQEGSIKYINQNLERIFGYDKNELLGEKIEILIPNRFNSEHVEYRKAYFKNSYFRPMGTGLDLYGKHKDGHDIAVEINLSPIEIDGAMHVIAAVRDVSERNRLKQMLVENEARWAFALKNANQGVWNWIVPEKIIYFSDAWKSMLGYQNDEVKNEQHEFESRLHPDDVEKVWCCLKEHFDGKTDEYICEARFRCKDGSYKWILDRGKVVSRDEHGNVLRAIGTHTDISAFKEYEKKLKQLAGHDPLTGVINRSLIKECIDRAIGLAKKEKSNVAVCYLDIDEFKQVNDRYGHSVGDLLLCEVTKCIQSCIRDTDMLIRLGGDEFALILLNIKKEQDVVKILKKILQRVSTEIVIDNQPFKVTLSAGVGFYPKDGSQLLLEKADAAMYDVKKHGKNNFKWFDGSIHSINVFQNSMT